MRRPEATRRLLLGRGLWGGVLGAFAALPGIRSAHAQQQHSLAAHPSAGVQEGAMSVHAAHGGMVTVGEVDDARNGFDPHTILTDWDTGTLTTDPDGRSVREFAIIAEDKEIEIAPGIFFPAWTYNGRVPGPTIRVTEGERVRVLFRNDGSHPHSMHFHGIHAARMDGVPGAGEVLPGGEFVYEFDAYPFGCHLYHCHTVPLKRHIHKGLYGAFIIDPDPARHPEAADAARGRLLGTPENGRWQEFVMVMNAFDTNFDDENEVYAVNTVAHAYSKRPIVIDKTPAGARLSRQRHRVRPDQFLPPARQLLRLLRPRHHARADLAHDRHRDAVPGAARHPRVQLRATTSPGSTWPTPTRPSSSSSAG